MRKDMDQQRQRERQESMLTEQERRAKREEEKYELERKILREQVLRERNDYLKKKVQELVGFLQHEGVKSVNSVPLKDVWSMHPEVENIYFDLKELADEINEKKQGEATTFANKLLNETDLSERAMRVFEKPLLSSEFQKRNDTEIADLKKYLEDKHTNDVKLKHLLINSSESKDIFLQSIMQQREQQLKEQTEEFLERKTAEIKEVIIQRATRKYRLEENKRIQEEQRKRFAERDRKLREQEGRGGETSGEGAPTFSRAGFGVERPQPSSDIKFGEKKSFENKGRAGPKKYGKEEGFSRAGFGKGDVEAGKEEERKEKPRDGPPKFGTGSKPPAFKGKTADDAGWKRGSTKPEEDTKKEAPKPKPASKPVGRGKDKNKDSGMDRFSKNW